MRFPAFLSNRVRRGRLPLQVGALPYRRGGDGKIEVMLVTSRGSGRWIVPKGWPMEGKTPVQAAEQEAYEEAGVRGYANPVEIGRFVHDKSRFLATVQTEIAVFPLAVQEELTAWPERGQRNRCWFPAEEAARAVHSPGLARIISELPANPFVD